MRIIDADALKEEICKHYRHFSQRLAISSVFEEIEKAPSIDAVPREKYDRMKENAKILSKACAEKEYVIRCKDCKYKAGTEDGEYNPEDIVCTYWMSDGLNEDDYCSYGERKEE